MQSLLVVAVFATVAGTVGGCQNHDEAAAPPPRSPPGAAPATPATPGAPELASTTSPMAPTALAPATTRSDEPYKNDVQTVCNVVELANATTAQGNDRAYLVATYLGTNLQTPDARKWLVSIQRLGGHAKADALEHEARRVGLARCALADEWRKPAPPAP